MKKLLISCLTLFALVGVAQAQAATTYYVCDTGSDANDGLTQATPWQTAAKAFIQFNQIDAGDTVAFCRGGQFSVSTNKTFNTRCQANNRCVMRDYGSASLPAPVLTNLNGNIFRFEDGGNADHDEGYVVKNLVLKGGGNGAGVFIYNDVDDILLDNLEIDNFSIGVHTSGGNAPNSGSDSKNDRITLQNSRIINNGGQGWLGGNDDLKILNNHFENNGYHKAIFNHNVYIAGNGVNNNVLVSGNTFYKSAVVNGGCQGVSLVVHGRTNNMIIENNHIYEDPNAVTGFCYGISVSPGNSKDEYYTNTIIRGNLIENVGSIAIGCASCDGLTIENNTITHIGSTMNAAISVPSTWEDSTKTNNVLIKNNIISVTTADSKIIGIQARGSGNINLVDNVVYVPNPNTQCFDNTTTGSFSQINTQCLLATGSVVTTVPPTTTNQTTTTTPPPTMTTTPPPVCSDGIDNDNDGLIDYPNDPGCTSNTDVDETNVVVTNTATSNSSSESDTDTTDSDTGDSGDTDTDIDSSDSDTTSDSYTDTDTTDSDDNADIDTTSDSYTDTDTTDSDETSLNDNTNPHHQTLRNQISTLLTQIKQLQTQLNIQRGQPVRITHLFKKAFQHGDEHSDVKILQQKLNTLGYTVATTGAGASGQETNYYGPLTIKAIQLFQCSEDIICHGDPDSTGYGNFGPVTRERMSGR